MFIRMIAVCAVVLFAGFVMPSAPIFADNDSGVIKLKSIYPVAETVTRLRKDIADKGIKFFDEIDQSKLAAGAGIQLRPSVLLIFGNPPLGTQFMTANPNAGLIGPCGCSCSKMRRGRCGLPTRTSAGLHADTESKAVKRNSRWLRW